MFSIVGLMFLIFIVKLFTLALQQKTREPRAEVERLALHQPISNMLSNNSNQSQGKRDLHSQLSGTSTYSAPSTSEYGIESRNLPPHPPTYTEVVGSAYKDDPPKYSEHPGK